MLYTAFSLSDSSMLQPRRMKGQSRGEEKACSKMEADCRWPSSILAETREDTEASSKSRGIFQGSTLMPSDKINPIGLLGFPAKSRAQTSNDGAPERLAG
jgi:hypothetical protein